MAIDIKFDLAGNPEPPTIILATRNGDKLGQLDVDENSIELTDKLNDASEFTFTLNKYIDGKLTNLWKDVVNFKLVYCIEWDMWFEITVELDEETETVKTVFCTQLGQAELSQIMLYNIEINTEKDIERDDYKITILWNADDPEASMLHRLLKDKAPHYSVIHVDSTIARIQRSFSFDDTSIYDAFQKISEEIGCLFVFHSNSDENGKIQRTISIYDLEQNCLNESCKHRGEFTDTCPKCGSKDIKHGYGEDTTIFVTADELASGGIQLTTDTDAVKNCFKLEAGDDLMTATVRNCNPNGTDYIWRFSDDTKKDMPKELVEKIDSYDKKYKEYHSSYISNLDTDLLNKYNALVDKYSVYNKDLEKIATPITGYSSLMNTYYNTIDLELYLKSSLMPSVEMSDTSAQEQARLLNFANLSPVAVTNIEYISLATADNAVLAMARTVVRPTYRVQINDSKLSSDNGTWTGNFIVTNYSDEEDTVISSSVSVVISDDVETFIQQKIDKLLNKENTDDLSIVGLFGKDIDNFKTELKKYALKPLTSFYNACQSCLDILIEQDVGSDTESDLYKSLYKPYYEKLTAIESEIKIREDEIRIITGTYDLDGEVDVDGLQTNIQKYQIQIQDELDFEKYLGNDLWLEFCAYRREDKYSNDNYISDGLNNAEIFERALEFYDVAENEIYKASELQHSISTSLNNLLAIPKFKSLVNSFNVGNWIRIQANDEVYTLRLLEYTIAFGNFDNISVEFSDVTKVKNGTSDVKDILSQASSMATSYGSVQRQANQGNKVKGAVDEWVTKGLNSALVRIQNNDNEEISLTKNGLLCRTYDDVTETYSPEQLKLTHNIMAYTDDGWETVKQALGKHEYRRYDKQKSDFVVDTGYGMTADFVTAGYISGSQIIGGDIYSSNYSVANSEGSYLNLLDGTFSFAGGKLVYDGTNLAVDGKITVATEGTIGCWTVNKSSIYKGSSAFGNASGMYFGTEGLSLGSKFKVKSDGSAIASDLTLTGGSLLIGTKSSDSYAEITQAGILNCKGANITGEINATSGTIGGCTIDESGHLQISSANIGNLTISDFGSISFGDLDNDLQTTIENSGLTEDDVKGITGTYIDNWSVSSPTVKGMQIYGGEFYGNEFNITSQSTDGSGSLNLYGDIGGGNVYHLFTITHSLEQVGLYSPAAAPIHIGTDRNTINFHGTVNFGSADVEGLTVSGTTAVFA